MVPFCSLGSFWNHWEVWVGLETSFSVFAQLVYECSNTFQYHLKGCLHWRLLDYWRLRSSRISLDHHHHRRRRLHRRRHLWSLLLYRKRKLRPTAPSFHFRPLNPPLGIVICAFSRCSQRSSYGLRRIENYFGKLYWSWNW